MPSLSLPSNPCGSGGTTSKLRAQTSSQVKSGGGGGIQLSGYEESHVVSSFSFSFSFSFSSSSSSSSSAADDGSFSFACFGSSACATSARSAASMTCSTSSPAINSNESNTCISGAGGSKLPDCSIVVCEAVIAVAAVELPS